MNFIFSFRRTCNRQEYSVKVAPAFTLSELLITIAIIALLASILIAAVSRAKDNAKLTLCQANLHGIGRGLNFYAAENNQFFPVSPRPGNPHKELLAALMNKYVENVEIFYCPSVTSPDMMLTDENVSAGQISYFYYSCDNAAPFKSDTGKILRNFGSATPNWPRHIDTNMSPETWVMSDAWISGEGIHPFGKKGMNYLVLAGAVEMLEDQPSSLFK